MQRTKLGMKGSICTEENNKKVGKINKREKPAKNISLKKIEGWFLNKYGNIDCGTHIFVVNLGAALDEDISCQIAELL